MPKFTPGPWEWGGADPEGWRYPTSVWCGARFIAATDGMTAPCEGSHKEQIANARLIAAAPDLFNALATLIGRLDAGAGRTLAMECDFARNALAKARGEI